MDFIRGQNTPYFSWKFEFQNMISGPLTYRVFRETGPTRLTGLIWRGPHWVPSTCAICAQRIWRVILTNQKQNEVPIQSLSAWNPKRSQDKMADDLPYKAEYAKSGRSSCKLCRSNIDKDSLRVAKMVQVRNLFQNSCLIWRIRSILSDDYQPWSRVIIDWNGCTYRFR